jgi:hypothetical protein
MTQILIAHDPQTNKVGIKTTASNKATISILLEAVRLLAGQLKEEPSIVLAKNVPEAPQ